ncbi:hypothetical protein MAR_015448, partial [Mya arenaria]
MAVYMMMLYVTREQENAIHELFSQRTWPLLKSDPSSVLRGPQHVFTFGSLQDRTWEFHTVPATQLSAMPAEEGEENNIVNGEGVEVQGVSELNDNHGDEIANNIEDAEHDTEDMSSNIQDMEDNTEDMSDNIEHMDDNIEDNIEDIEDKKVDDKKKSDNSRKKKKINDDDYIPYKYTYPKPPKKPKTPRKDKESKPPKP